MKAFITVGIILLLISCSDESLISYNEQLTKDIQLVDSYLKANSILTEKDSSGFRFIITSIGNNYKPKLIDSVIIKTSVHLLSGQSISSNSIAVRRGRLVNRITGDPAEQLAERHEASDFSSVATAL